MVKIDAVKLGQCSRGGGAGDEGGPDESTETPSKKFR